MEKVGEKFFRRYSVVAVLALLILFIFFLFNASRVGLDYDFEKFYPTDDPETAFFLNYREKFESDNDFLLISLENKGGIFQMPFLKKVDRFAKELDKVKDVKLVLSITTQKEFFIFPVGSDERPYINFEDIDLKRDSANIYENIELINTLVSEDAKSLCLYLRHEDNLSKKRSDVLISRIKSKADKYHFQNVRIAGRTIGQKYYIEKMTGEMIFFVAFSAVLIIVFLAVAFRSIWGILLPQVVIFSAMIWLIGGMRLFDQPVNIILTVLPSVMFVVSMSDVIHLVSRYLDAIREGYDRIDSIKTAIKEVGLATFLTSITTAIGFFSLIFVRVEPIQVFGMVMGVGVMIAFVLTFAILPALFYMFPGPRYVTEKKKDNFWRKRLEKWYLLVARNPKRILIVSIGVLTVCVIGTFQIESDNLLMDDLNEEEPLKKDFDYLDKHYGGVRPFEMAVTIKDTNVTIWDDELFATLDTVEQYLEEDYGVSVQMSLVKSMKVLHRSMNAGNVEEYRLPSQSRKKKRIRQAILSGNKGTFINAMVDTTRTVLRIGGAIPDIGNKAITAKNDKLYRYLKDKTLGGKIEYQVTGTAHLIDKNMSYMSTSLVIGLAISVGIVAILMGLIYKSVSIMLISLVPNLVPLVFIGGVMGFAGVDLKISTAIIFTIAFGIAVDDTIHLLGKFKYELLKGKGKVYALRRSFLTTGKAMILTTLILCAGFLLLIFSDFNGTFYMGVMLCLGLFIALIADLTLLQVLLLLFYNPKRSKRD